MLLNRYLSAVCIGLVCLVQPVGVAKSTPRDNLVAVALTPNQIEAKAARFVVRIDGKAKNEETDKIVETSGSGFIFNKNGNTYTVLTAAHVVNNSIGIRTITTPDGKSHSFNASSVRVLSSKIDLAEITFVSNQTYEVAKFKSNKNISLRSSVFVYGWNAIDPQSYSARLPRLSPGTFEQEQPIENNQNGGYTLVIGKMAVIAGFSGSPILDENGEVIGIYGMGDAYGSTFGISIATYQRYANIPKPIPAPSINTSVTSINRSIPVIPTPQAGDTNPKPRSNSTRPIPNNTIVAKTQTPVSDVVGLLVILSLRRVYVYRGNQIIAHYPVAIGKKGWETPVGEWFVIEKIKNPGWTNPKTGQVIKPGDKKNLLGERWIGFWTDDKDMIGFNGTYSPQSVETGTTNGNVRMYDRDVKELFEFVKIGTTVQVVN